MGTEQWERGCINGEVEFLDPCSQGIPSFTSPVCKVCVFQFPSFSPPQCVCTPAHTTTLKRLWLFAGKVCLHKSISVGAAYEYTATGVCMPLWTMQAHSMGCITASTVESERGGRKVQSCPISLRKQNTTSRPISKTTRLPRDSGDADADCISSPHYWHYQYVCALSEAEKDNAQM